MKTLQRVGGFAALTEAAVYIIIFLFYGVIFNPPQNPSLTGKFVFLHEHKLVLYTINLTGYVLFGIVLVVLVIAIDESLKSSSPRLSRVASVFGFLWGGLVIAAGMIANIGLASVIKAAAANPEQAQAAWVAISAVVEGLGGGNEIVGGLWVLLLSIAALRGGGLSNMLGYFGILVGSVGILTIYPNELFTQIFGFTQIVWFIWLGTEMLRQSRQNFQTALA